jgi:hypothetical protein
MSVNPGREAEYEARHSPIWPELERTFRDHGVQTYTIFLHHETRQLFAYVDRIDVNARARSRQQLGLPCCRRAAAGKHRPLPVERQEYGKPSQRAHARSFSIMRFAQQIHD